LIFSELKFQVFINYAREDWKIAKKIYDDLKRQGITPWLDTEDLLPGQDWREVISEAIKYCPQFLTLLSSRSVSKQGFVQKELKIALDLLDEFPPNKIFIIPVRIDECTPNHSKLDRLQRVDLFPSYETALNMILAAIRLKPNEIDANLVHKGQPKYNSLWSKISGTISLMIPETHFCLYVCDSSDSNTAKLVNRSSNLLDLNIKSSVQIGENPFNKDSDSISPEYLLLEARSPTLTLEGLLVVKRSSTKAGQIKRFNEFEKSFLQQLALVIGNELSHLLGQD